MYVYTPPQGHHTPPHPIGGGVGGGWEHGTRDHIYTHIYIYIHIDIYIYRERESKNIVYYIITHHYPTSWNLEIIWILSHVFFSILSVSCRRNPPVDGNEAEFQGRSPQFIWPTIWYVYVPPSVGS